MVLMHSRSSDLKCRRIIRFVTVAVLFAWSLQPTRVFTSPHGQARERQPSITQIHITAERFSFTPSRIKIKQGTRVELVLSSEDTTHGFRIARLGINRRIPFRGEVKVAIEVEKRGNYIFECSRLCGAGHNMMRGLLIVE